MVSLGETIFEGPTTSQKHNQNLPSSGKYGGECTSDPIHHCIVTSLPRIIKGVGFRRLWKRPIDEFDLVLGT